MTTIVTTTTTPIAALLGNIHDMRPFESPELVLEKVVTLGGIFIDDCP